MAPPQEAKRPNAYLIVYNLVVAAGWSYVLARCVIGNYNGDSTASLWQEVELALKVAQTAAVLEIVHSVTGLVKSPLFTTLMQVFSRIWLLWGIINLVPGPTTTGAVQLLPQGAVQMLPQGLPLHLLQLNLYTLLYAWSITEVIRYTMYALKEIDCVPYVLTWLRYTTFYVLYPLGVSSEMSMVYLALPTIKAQQLWSPDMPNPVNFAVNYYLICLLIVAGYLPGFPQLYTYMIKQRKKVLAPATRKTLKTQ